MALADDEQRLLAAMERALRMEDPRLVSLFTEQPKVSPAKFAWAVFGTVLMVAAGAAFMVTGFKMSEPALMVLGGALAILLPVWIASRLSS